MEMYRLAVDVLKPKGRVAIIAIERSRESLAALIAGR